MQLICNGVIILFKKINIYLYFTIIIIIIQNNNLNTFFKTSTTSFIHYILVSFMISLSFDSHTLSFHVEVCFAFKFFSRFKRNTLLLIPRDGYASKLRLRKILFQNQDTIFDFQFHTHSSHLSVKFSCPSRLSSYLHTSVTCKFI